MMKSHHSQFPTFCLFITTNPISLLWSQGAQDSIVFSHLDPRTSVHISKDMDATYNNEKEGNGLLTFLGMSQPYINKV